MTINNHVGYDPHYRRFYIQFDSDVDVDIKEGFLSSFDMVDMYDVNLVKAIGLARTGSYWIGHKDIGIIFEELTNISPEATEEYHHRIRNVSKHDAYGTDGEIPPDLLEGNDKYTLKDLQVQGVLQCVNKLKAYRKCIISDTMGLGKTAQALAVLKYLYKRNKGFKTCIVTPATLVTNWVDEIKNWYAGVLNVKVCRVDKREHLEMIGGADICILSINKLATDYPFFESILNELDVNLVIVDEAHRIKSEANKTTECLRQVVNTINKQRSAKNSQHTLILALTGTLIRTSAFDIFTLLKNMGLLWVLENYGEKDAFMKRFVKISMVKTFHNWGRGIKKALNVPVFKSNPKYIRDLYESLAKTVMIRRTVDKDLTVVNSICTLILPNHKPEFKSGIKEEQKTLHSTLDMAMRYDVRKFENKLIPHKDTLKYFVESHDLAGLFDEVRIKRFFAGNRELAQYKQNEDLDPADQLAERKRWRAVERSKADQYKLQKLIEIRNLSLARGHKKAVMFYKRTAVGIKACEILNEYFGENYAVQVQGKDNKKQRQANLKDFASDEGLCKVLVVQSDIGGEGLTLTSASCTIFLQAVSNSSVFVQCLKRVHRQGQTKNTDSFFVVVQGTADEEAITSMYQQYRENRDFVQE